jgi:hypothetical protein
MGTPAWTSKKQGCAEKKSDVEQRLATLRNAKEPSSSSSAHSEPSSKSSDCGFRSQAFLVPNSHISETSCRRGAQSSGKDGWLHSPCW